jgi:hypothetical protein
MLIKPRLRNSMLKHSIFKFLMAFLVTILCCVNHGGFLVFFVALVFVPWVMIKAALALRNPGTRKYILETSSIWLASIFVISAVHMVRATSARRKANQIAAQILEYKTKHGSYPIEDALIPQHLDVFYLVKDGKPNLFYLSTFYPFSTYAYDFETHAWEFHGD